MSIVIDGERVPKLLSRKNASSVARPAGNHESSAEPLRIALINNMPDSALEDTEVQFFELLESAAGEIPVSLKLYSLPELPRSEAGEQHLRNFYHGIGELLKSRFDGMIMTGTEPRQPDLRNEPYWPALTEVLEWAERNTASTVLSCLAAHAGVLHSDGIPRHRLSDKQFGVFAYKKVRDHALTDGLGDRCRIPHSRWNEVRADALTARGYEVLTQSAEAGVDLFVKKKKDSLFVHFQGHPRVQRADSAEGISERYKKVFEARERNLSKDAGGIFRRRSGSGACGFSKDGRSGPARGSAGKVSRGCSGASAAGQLASVGCGRISQLVAVLSIEES